MLDCAPWTEGPRDVHDLCRLSFILPNGAVSKYAMTAVTQYLASSGRVAYAYSSCDVEHLVAAADHNININTILMPLGFGDEPDDKGIDWKLIVLFRQDRV